MRAIFLSYRRDDAEGQAGRLFDDLTRHFGEDAVFMDVAAIDAGRDFRLAIDEQVASCGVLLAIIGKSWLTATDGSGARRLDDPKDFVRLETASALKRDIPVVPVLVHGARMPRVEDLPEDLKDLAFRNGVELTHARWDSDVEVLVKALRPYVLMTQVPTNPRPQPMPSEKGQSRPGFSRMIIAVLVLMVAIGGYSFYLHQKSSDLNARKMAMLEKESRAGGATTVPPMTSGSAPTEGTLHVRTIVEPPSVNRGEKATLYVTVLDGSNNSVDGVKVLVQAGGGKFLETANTTYDSNATLMGPFDAAGLTSLAGDYTTWWVCSPCSPAYTLGVKASKKGYSDAVSEITIKIN